MTAPVSRSGPLSYAQQGLWLVDRLTPGESLYNETQAVRLIGRLDHDALREALNASVRRHEVLRTRFKVENGTPIQVVEASLDLPLVVDDLRGYPAEERDPRARRLARKGAGVAFDLTRVPLLRARLICLDDAEHWLVVTIHHIVTDGWSTSVLWQELAAYYTIARDRLPSSLPDLPLQYADFASTQRVRLTGERAERLLSYWKQALAGMPALDLPGDRPRAAMSDHRGASVAFEIPPEVTRRLKALGRQERTTPFVTLLAAFEVLVFRICGQEDFGIGVPVAGRDRRELEALIGLFANMVVMRGDLSGRPTFVDALARVRRRALETFERQEWPFERLVMALAPTREISRNPLFQVTFALNDAGPATWRLPGLVVEPIDVIEGAPAKFDLSLTVIEAGEALRGRFDYAARLFDGATVEGWAASFRSLLASIAANPGEFIGRLALHDPVERNRRLAQSCSDRGASVGSPERIEQLFERRVRARPEAISVVDDSGALSYRGLDERASALASVLRRGGLGASRRIGVCLDRGQRLVVALLAVLKAGGTAVPLDPDQPAARLTGVVVDAKIECVLTEERLLAKLTSASVRVVCLDRDHGFGLPVAEPGVVAGGKERRLTADPAGDESTGGVAANDVAFVMYTSGSTGRPKGVLIPHAAVTRLVVDTDYAQLGPDDVVAHLANPAFDAINFEVWGALLNGARLATIAKATAIEPRALAEAIRARGVTAMFVTTALFNAVAREVPAAFATCRQVLFGGETVETRRVREVMLAGPPGRLVHVYGPTETTTFATWHDVSDADAERATIPIGRPIAGMEVYVLDAEGEIVPAGVVGEIHIGGSGLARGYLDRPDLTRDRFVAHPFRSDPAAKVYRTGDLARCRPDGSIEFIGRRDRQVKIRGFRVELGEVESVLARLPGVSAAAVAVRGATSDAKRLVAWLVAADADAPPPSLLREMRRLLPDPMVPAAIVWVPRLPVNANGKIDFAALPEPGEHVRPDRGASVPPRDMFEGVLARIWEELLGVRGVGVHDHFFDLGGHSLVAARLVDTIERVTGLRVPLTALFVDDTIDGLARVLREGAPATSAPIVTVNETGRRPPFVFLHGDFQAGGFYSRALARALGDDQPTLIVHPHGLAGEAVPATIERMAADRITALRKLRPTGPYVIGGHCNGALVAFEMARQLVAGGEAVPAVVLIEARAPLGQGELPERGGTYVKFDANGRPRVLAPQDRLTDVELSYNRAIDAYAGGRFDGHAVVVQAQEWRHPSPDAGWSRHVRSCEGHVLPGGHVTLITDHLATLADTIRGAIDGARERGADDGGGIEAG